MIKEYVYDGQRVAGWSVDYLNGSTWTSLVSGKKVIGYKRICKFNQVTASQVRLNITRSWDNPEISDFALYRTLSGIDTTQEDTTLPVGVAPVSTTTASVSIQPKIAIAANRLTVDAAGFARHPDRACTNGWPVDTVVSDPRGEGGFPTIDAGSIFGKNSSRRQDVQ